MELDKIQQPLVDEQNHLQETEPRDTISPYLGAVATDAAGIVGSDIDSSDWEADGANL